MTPIHHTVGPVEVQDIDLQDICFDGLIKFNEVEYTHKVSSGLDDWMFFIGESFSNLVSRINVKTNKDLYDIEIYNLKLADFVMSPLTFINNRMQLRFNYEVKKAGRILRSGVIYETKKYTAIKHGTLARSTEFALIECMKLCLQSLQTETKRVTLEN